jgi:hypothetical protein
MENLDLQKGNLPKKSRLKTKKRKNKSHTLFSQMFNFLGFNPTSMHICSQTCPPLARFFQPNNAFKMSTCAPSIDVQLSPQQTLSIVL